MDGDVVAEVLAGLGLDVVDVHRAERLDRDDLLLAQVRAALRVAQVERREQLALLARVDEADELGEARALEPIEIATSCMSWRSARRSGLCVRRE